MKRSPILKFVLRAHAGSIRGQNARERNAEVLRVLAREIPDDEFSLSQWEIGLQYYRDRFRASGASGGLLLDLGCGSGNWSIAGGESFDRVIGIDVRKDRLGAASSLRDMHKAGNVSFARGSISELPFPDGKADWVIAYNVLPYVPGWEKAIDEAGRVLSPGGTFWCAWNAPGSVLFDLINGLQSGRFRFVREALRAFFRHLTGKRPARLESPLYLTLAQITSRLNAAGLEPTWDGSGSAWPAGAKPLFPQRFLGFAFFHEILAVKRR